MANNQNRKKENPVIEWISDNLRYMELGAAIAVVVLVIIFAVRAFAGRNNTSDNPTSVTSVSVQSSTEETADEQTDSSIEQEQTERVVSASSETASEEEDPEEEESEAGAQSVSSGSEAVTSAVQEYFSDVNGNNAGSQILTDSVSDTYVVSSDDLGGIIVFVSYRYTVSGSDVEIPALTEMFLVENEDGTYQVLDEVSDVQSAAMQEALDHAEIQSMISQVQSAYNAVISENPELADA